MIFSDFQKRKEENRAIRQACSSLAGKKAENELMKIEEELRGIEEEMMKEASEKLKEDDTETTTTTKKTKKSKKGGSSKKKNNKKWRGNGGESIQETLENEDWHYHHEGKN